MKTPTSLNILNLIVSFDFPPFMDAMTYIYRAKN